MKAYKVYVKYAMSYSNVVEEIEVDRMTEKSYYQGSRMSRRLTEDEVVFATREGAIGYAKETTQDKIVRVQADLDRLQARLAKIEAMEAE
jgi:predicted transcriptional regulator